MRRTTGSKLVNREEGRPASAQNGARPRSDVQPGASRPAAASRSLPARQAVNGEDGNGEKKVVRCELAARGPRLVDTRQLSLQPGTVSVSG